MQRSKLVRLAIIALPLLFIAAAAFLSLRSPEARREGTAIVRSISDAEPKAALKIPLVMREGGEVDHEMTHVYEAVRGLPGAADAKFASDPPSVEVRYDPARLSEQQIRDALAAAGYGGTGQ